MSHFLIISSQVAHGHVGLSAMMPTLQAMGHQVTALPTILLSHHAGHKSATGAEIPPQQIWQMFQALQTDGHLKDVEWVISGYLPSQEHVEIAEKIVRYLRTCLSSVRYVCDPVIGDDPKGLYIAQTAAQALRRRLLPNADIITPNRFELSWLTDQKVDDVDTATKAAQDLNIETVIATSLPIPDGEDQSGQESLGSLLVANKEKSVFYNQKHSYAPHGTGDLLTALLAGHCASGLKLHDALNAAITAIAYILKVTPDGQDMNLAAHLSTLTAQSKN